MFSTASFRGWVEFSPSFAPRREISHVLFDFDGTLSLIREGWPEVMLPMFVELLPKQPGDREQDVQKMLFEDMMRLNGKQTIYQMIQFADRVKERGIEPRDPKEYKKEYLRRLTERIGHRLEKLSQGAIQRDDLLVFGARQLLEELHHRGLRMYLASGTDEPDVKHEAELLGVAHYFEGRIYGAKDDYKSFSKKKVIERMLQENSIPGDRLLAFGDGYVEIQNTKEAGGLAVAVASDEANNGSGRADEWKRLRLLGVGADAVIADFRDAKPLLECILGPPT